VANEDFVVRFGSNANTFKVQLKKDITEVNSLVSELRQALAKTVQLDVGGVGGAGGRPPRSGGAPIDKHYDQAVGKLIDGLEVYNQTLGSVIRNMDGASRLLERAAKAVANRSSGATRSEAAKAREATTPGESNLPNVRKAQQEAVKAALDGASDTKDPFTAHVRDVPRVEIDAAALDRISVHTKTSADQATASNRKMDHLIGLINRGITVKVQGDGRGGSGDGHGGSGRGSGGTPATPKGSPAQRDSGEDPFGRVSQIRGLIKKRERETALFKEMERLTSGQGVAPSGAALKTLSGGSKGFNKVLESTGGGGDEYKGRVQKAIDSVRSELADVPKLKTLRAQLRAAIDVTGTPDGRQTREQRLASVQTRVPASTAKPATTPGAGRAPESGEDKNTRLQRLATESLAVMKGYQVVVAGLSEAVDDVKAGRKVAPANLDLQAKLAKAKQDLAEAEQQWARAKRKADGVPRAETKAQNRLEAEAKRSSAGPQVGARDARDRLDFMDVAGSTDALRGQSVKRLRELAATFRTEGYEVKVPRTAKKDELASILNSVHKEFEKAGRVTNSNLESRAQRQDPTVISPQARQIIGDLLGKVGKNDAQRENDKVITEAYQGGYSGRGKGRRGRVDTAFPVKNNREEINTAEETGQARLDRIARAATKQAREQLAKNPALNPFADDVTVKGGGQAAGDARFALKAIRAVVDRFDKLGQAALHVHDDLEKMDGRLKRLAGLEARADSFARKKNLTNADKEQYTDVLSQIKDLKPRVAADGERRGGLEADLAEFYKKARQAQVTTPSSKMPDGTIVPGKRIRGLGIEVPENYFARNNFGPGFEARKKSRYDAETVSMQRADAAGDKLQKAQSSKADVVDSLREALFGARNALNSTGQVSTGVMKNGQSTVTKRVDQRRMLPDVFNEEAIQRDFPKYQKTDLTAAQQATNKVAAEIKRQRGMEQQNRLLTEQGKAAKFSPEQIAAQGGKVEERLKRLFDAVDKVTGQATAKAEREAARLRLVDPYGKGPEEKNTRTSRRQADTSVLGIGTVTRAENIIAGGQVTKDMPLVMGRLAKTMGLDYKTDIKGQSGYEGIAGLKRLLAEALKGPAAGGGKSTGTTPEVRAALKTGQKGGFDDDCCTKIVAGLNAINTTLKGGLRVVGLRGDGKGEDTVVAGKTPRVAGGRRTAAMSPEEVLASKALIRQERQLVDAARTRRIATRQETENQAGTSATMKEVQAARDLAATIAVLDERTKAHIATLKRLKEAGASNIEIQKAMENVYRGASVNLRERNPAEGVGRRVDKIGGVISDVVGAKVPTGDVRRLGADIESELSNSLRQAAMQNTGNAGPLVEALFGGKGFMSRVLNSTGTFLVRNFTAGFVFGITNALQDAAMQAIETESTFVRVSEALASTGRETGGLRTQLAGISQDYGVALKDVYTTAAGLTGVTDNNAELLALTKVATELQLISGGALNATEAMKALSGITSAYGETSAEHIADVATVIQNRLSVNIEETIEGVARLSGQAVELGLDFENAAVYVAAISKFTNQTGAGAGEQFSRILASLQTGRVQGVVTKALGNADVDVSGAFAARDYQGVLTSLLGTYDQLSKAEQDRVAIAIGGQRQAAAVNGLLREGAKINATVTAAVQSQGAAEERATAISAELAAMIVRVRQAFVNFIGVLQRSGAFEFFKVALGTALYTLEGINYGLNKFNDLLDTSPLTRFGRTAVGIFAGLLITVALVRKGILGMMGALGAARIAASVVTGGALSGVAAGSVGAAGGAGAAGAMAARTASQQAVGRQTLLASLAGVPAFFAGRRAAARNQGTYARRDSLGYASALGYGAMAIPSRRIGIDFDEDGNERGRSNMRGRFFGARSVNADNRAERLTASAARLEERAAAARAASSARFAGSAASAGAGAARAGAAVNAGLGAAMAGLSVASAPAVAGLLLVTAGIASLAFELNNQSKAQKEYKKRYDKVFGAQGKKEDEEKIGVSDNLFRDAVDKNREKRDRKRDFFSFLSNEALNVVGAGQSGDERQGIISDNLDEQLRNENEYSFAAIRLAGKDKVKIERAVDAGMKGLRDEAKAISESGLSGEQKDTATALIQDEMNRLQQKGSDALMAANGMNKLNALTLDQLQNIGTLVSTIVNFSPELTKEFAPLLQNLVNSFTFDENSEYQKLLDSIVAPNIQQQKRDDLELAVLPDTLTKEGEAPKRVDSLKSYTDSLTTGAPARVDSLKPLTETEVRRNATPQVTLQADRRKVGIEFLKGALKSATISLDSIPDQNSEPAVAARAAAISLAGQLSQAIADNLNATVADASALAESLRFGGDFVGAAAAADSALAALRGKRDALDPNDLAARAALNNQINAGLKQKSTDEVQEQVNANLDDARQTRIRRNVLAFQVDNAKILLDRALKTGSGFSATDKQGLRDSLQNLLNQSADLRDQETAAAEETAASNIAPGDAAAVANKRVANARSALERARKYSESSTEFQTATQNLTRALRDAVNVDFDIVSAQSELGVALAEAAGDRAKAAGLVADQAQAAYDKALTDAGGNVNAPSVIRADAARVRARASERDALSDTLSAESELATAIAEAAGNRISVARKASAEAERKYQDALKNAGGDKTNATVIRADAARIAAKANERDTVLNDSLATIDFQQEIGEISANTAISMLQELLRQTNLTEEQRRSLRLKIKGLQADIRGQLTASGFNIPSEVSLPTAYEVRRSLGIDPYVKQGQDRLNDLGKMRDTYAAQALPQFGTNAPRQMQQQAAGAVTNNNNEVTVNNTVSTPAMVEAVARRVVELIATSTNMGARANQTSPSLVRY
jgi:hypothetical protein